MSLPMNKSRSLLIIVSAVFFCFCLFTRPVHAFTVAPVLFDTTIEPGASIQGSVQATNDTKDVRTYYVNVQNFVPLGEEGQQTFLPESDTSGLAGWISADASSMTLRPGESRELHWVLHPPTDAEPGGHYAALFFSTVSSTERTAASVGVGAKTGVLFLVNVTGNIHEQASVDSFTVPSNIIDHKPIGLELRVRNEGSVHVIPQGSVIIQNIFGSRVSEIALNPTESRVLPSSIRRIDLSWGQDFHSGRGSIEQLKAEWNGFAFGRYTAKVVGTYGQLQQPLTAEVTFWVIPWRLLICAILLVLILLMGVKGYNALVIRSATSKRKT